MANVAPPMLGFLLEQARSCLGGAGQNTALLHINVITNLQRNDCDLMMLLIVPLHLLFHLRLESELKVTSTGKLFLCNITALNNALCFVLKIL